MANPTNLFSQAIATNGDKNIIPNTTTTSGAMSQSSGFPAECSKPLGQGGVPPARADFNGIFYMLSAFAMMAQRGGIWQYESTVAYQPPAFIQDTTNSNYYICIAAITGTAPSADDGTHWKKILNSDGTVDVPLLKNVTATAAELNVLHGITASTVDLNAIRAMCLLFYVDGLNSASLDDMTLAYDGGSSSTFSGIENVLYGRTSNMAMIFMYDETLPWHFNNTVTTI